MSLTNKQIEVLKKRKKELENYQLFAFLLIPVLIVLIFIGNLITWILVIVVIFTFPSYWTRKKELTQIEYKLAAAKSSDDIDKEEFVKFSEYIKNLKKKGKTKLEIKQILVKKGLDEETAEASLNKV